MQSVLTSGASIEVADRDRPMSMDELSDMTMDPINEAFDGVDIDDGRRSGSDDRSDE